MDRMTLPNIYRQIPDLLHTSSDGQKFEVSVDSLNANYSFKYLGKDKGVSVVTFIDMRHMQWHSTVISSAEGVLHHCTTMSVDKAYTDSHGQSEVGFAFAHLLGFQLLPRLKGIRNETLNRPGIGKTSDYPNLQPILARPINWQLIKEQI
jgi:TnpA family transposase